MKKGVTNNQRVHITISGDVQGVGFRAFVLRQAQDLRCVGWVKNRDDGAVESLAEGEREALEELMKACKRGPEVAWVKHVEVRWEKAMGEFVTFEIVY